MSNFKAKVLTFAVGAAFSFSAVAGEFSVWSYTNAKSGQHDVIVSFAGDGIEQEAMADFHVPSGAVLVNAEILVKGSVCVGLDDNSYVRAVPPSGAGKPLPSKETDYCRFTFNLSKAASGASLELTEKFTECSSPGSEIKSCGLQIHDVSEK